MIALPSKRLAPGITARLLWLLALREALAIASGVDAAVGHCFNSSFDYAITPGMIIRSSGEQSCEPDGKSRILMVCSIGVRFDFRTEERSST